MYRNNSPKRFVHEGFREVLDEGVGVVQRCTYKKRVTSGKGGQSLTSKETSSVRQYCCPARGTWEGIPPWTIPTMFEITEKFELETPKTHLYHLTIHFEVGIPRNVLLRKVL